MVSILLFKSGTTPTGGEKMSLQIVCMAGVTICDRGPGHGDRRYYPQRGGVSRLAAAGRLAADLEKSLTQDPSRGYFIVTTGGMQKNMEGQTISRAKIAREIIVGKYHANAKHVVALTSPPDTLGNMEVLWRFIEALWDQNPKVLLLTEGYHLSRTTIMFLGEGQRRCHKWEPKLPPDLHKTIEGILDPFTKGIASGMQTTDKLIAVLGVLWPKALPVLCIPRDSLEVLAAQEDFEGRAGKRYAKAHAKDPHFLAARQQEAQGILDYLSGDYKRKTS
ncbi:MAG: YdcF family protein [Candidatus Wildermuthbacteria bacterium]|nr:YdcF family protein [Candidatus Wildermuthbacteria bacterium]